MGNPSSLLDEAQNGLLGGYLTSSGPSPKGEWRGFCVAHEDPNFSSTPSASYNFARDAWHCMGCNAGGTISTLVAELATNGVPNFAPETPEKNVVSIKSGKPPQELPSQESVETWNHHLLTDEDKLGWLETERGIDADSVTEFEIGFEYQRKRFMIPVRDADGTLINVRRYRKDAQAKMLPWADGYPVSLFNAAALRRNDAIVLCEGEFDCILLNQHGIPAVTTTAGVEGFQSQWAQEFKNKIVWICLDADDAGARGTAKVAELLREVATAVYAIQLTFDNPEHNDITHFFHDERRTVEEFRKAMEEATASPLFDARNEESPVPTSGKSMSLEESQRAASGEVAELYVRVFGKQTPAYIVPKTYEAVCSQDKGTVCKTCPMRKYDGQKTQEIRIDNAEYLKFLDATDNQVTELLREGVRARCKDRIQFRVTEELNVEQLVVGQSIEHLGDEVGAPYSDTIYAAGSHRTPVNTVARVVGRRQPDPRTQRGAFYSWLLEPQTEDIDALALSVDDLEDLASFQPAAGQSPLEKCREISNDLSANVTQIYGRNLLHVGYDIAYHSVLAFNFAGRPVAKGWVDMLVIGDTRTGKSEAASKLRAHYNAGSMTSCEGATLAGLLGGAQQMNGKHWMVTWGIIPRNDRRLVIMDEFSGMKDKNVIDELSSVRSEGVARITKIATEETSARTRLIWISNPSDGKTLSESKGMVALRKLISNPEDIARFDYVLAASNKDVPSSVINSLTHNKVDHIYKAELCQKLLLWVWSRRADQVRFTRAATEAVIAAAGDLGTRYVPDPPLVQVENIRMKLARIAVSIAARTFSTNQTGELVIVRPDHVESAVQFLDDIYSDAPMGYRKHSIRTLDRRVSAVGFKPEVEKMLQASPKLLTVLYTLQDGGRFKMRDLDELGGAAMGLGGGSDIAHWLIERKMVQWLSGGFLAMEPALIEILADMEG